MKKKNNILVFDPFLTNPVDNNFNQLVRNYEWLNFFKFHPSLNEMHTLEHPNHFDGIIILGSASNLCDNLPWHNPLAEYCVNQLKRGVPILGVCFGHQLMANAFGSKIDFYREDHETTIGFRQIEYRGEKFQIGVSHKQVVKELSSELEEQSVSSYKNDVVTHKNLPYWGIQLHPESSHHFLELTCKVPSIEDRNICIHSGERFIRLFLKEFNLHT
ncbi:MAG: hypothetical protein H6621_05445 [Halobacteriovoraceae bacterium]|nr:hypothetical protein [Halobacteriovoraceae bacterium]